MNDVRNNHSIAIVGIGCRFAGADDLHQYWEMLLAGRDAFGPVPADRWDHKAVFDANPRAADKAYVDAGAFIQDIRSFPAVALQIPPRRVEVMDPQQRLALECGLNAIEDAGTTPDAMPRRTGVYIGITSNEYRQLMGQRIMAQLTATGMFGEPAEDPSALAEMVRRIVPPRPFSAAGTLTNMTAANLAQELRLTGPAYSVDAACSSAMVAVADAVNALRTGQIDAALAGGVYLCITPEHHIAFSRVGAMSRSGQCLPFDARADGFVQGDGGGILYLKRLSDAERDGDRIYAVIDGIALNNDGGGEGPMAPVTDGQKDVIRLAWNDAGYDAADLGYVEAHGTGTQVGDLVEFTGLLETVGSETNGAAIGSAKANVGHTMSAAGVAGMIRAILSVYHGQIAPMANFDSPKPDLSLDASPFRIPKAVESWDAERRVACVSAFGFGGTNAHAVLSSVPAAEPATEQAEVVLLSAPDEASVRDLALRTAAAIEADPNATPAAVARAWSIRRRQPGRVGVVARTRQELIDALREVGQGGYPDNAAVGTSDGDPPRIAFLYPGQGSQRVGMLAGIRDRFPVVAGTIAEMDEAAEGITELPLSHYLYPERRSAPVDAERADAELTATENCQPALLTCGVALTRLLAQVGVVPDVVAGHSVGEFTAAVAGGVLEAGDGVRWAASRGRAMASLPLDDAGAMAALVADRPTVESLLVPGAVIANVNHPRQMVVSGSSDAVAQVVAAAEAKEIKAVTLAVSHAFHSPVFSELDLNAEVDALDLSAPSIPVASCIHDHPYRDADDARAVFRKHAVSPVHFTGTLEQCTEIGADLFLQVAPGGPTVSFARGTLRDVELRGILSIATSDDADGGASFLRGLCDLWVRGVDIDPRAIIAEGPVAGVPPTVLPREPYWAVRDGSGVRLKIATDVDDATGSRPAVVEETPEVAPVAAAGASVADVVIAAVARASAYPKDALRPTMRLADDLGFDSMMVADLAEDLTKNIDGVQGIPQEILLNEPTIQDLIDFASNPAAYAAGGAGDDDAPLSRYALQWVPTALPDAAPRTGTVFIDGPGADERWAAAFGAAGFRVALGEDTEFDTLVWIAAGLPLPTVGAVLADEASAPDLAGDFIATLDALAVADRQVDVVVVRDRTPWAEALSGVVRAVSRDWTDATCKAITDESEPVEVATRVALELGSADRTVDVCYDAGVRSVLGTARIAEAAEPWQPSASDTVVISGGTRGIGAKLAERLASTGARVVLVGRRDPGEEARALIAASEGRVVHCAVDVTDKDAVRRAFAPYQVTGFVHAAGLLADGALGTVDAKRGALARAVKVDGFLNTLVAVNGSLDVALCIGSWAGRFGSRHQAHYAAANAMMAELVEQLPARIRGVCSEFGPWSDSEMAETIPEAVQQAMRADGVDFVADSAGLDALMEDLGSSRGIVVRGRRVPTTTRRYDHAHTYSTSSDPYLRDHAIEGHPVLPLAAATDALAAASALDAPFEVRDLKLFQGIVVDDPITVEAHAVGDRVELRSEKGRTLHYQATVRPLSGAVDAPDETTVGDAPSLTLERFYDEVTFHGPLFRGIVSVDRVGSTSAAGVVKASDRCAWVPGSTSPWSVDPLVLDSALQLAAFIDAGGEGRVGTPVGMDRYAQLRPAPAPGTELRAQVRMRGDVDGDRFGIDVTLRDADGVFAVCENVVIQIRQLAGSDELPEGWNGFEVKPEWTDASEFPGYKDLQLRFQMVEAMGLQNPYFDLHEGTARDTSIIDGRECINFSSYNYVGLSGDERIQRDVTAAMARYGTSVSASRIASGERPFHRDLEALLAESLGVEDTIIFPSGHATNVTVIGHLFGPNDLILHDELIHDSCLQGIKLSGAARRGFRHEDIAHCEEQLRELRPHYEKVLLLTEGVYSMDGDISNTPEFVRLKRKYGCMLMIDEAHSFGTIGARGMGIRDHYGLEGPEVDLWMGTMSKSLASTGGWIGGTKALVTYLRYTTPGFVFAAGMTPTLGQAALSALRLIHEEPWRVEKLQSNARYFAKVLTERGLDIGVAEGRSPVVPVVTGSSMHALQLAQALLDNGINAKPIIFPAVADDAARLRFFLSSCHTEEQLLRTADTVKRELERIRAGS